MDATFITEQVSESAESLASCTTSRGRFRNLREYSIVAALALLLTSISLLRAPSLFSSADFIMFYKPNFVFLADAVKEFRLPLWNPYIGLGRPFLADIQNGVFYPPIYLVLLGPEVGALLLLWLHATWMACGIKRFGCAIGITPWIGYALGFAFFFSGACLSRLQVGQIMFVCGMSYIPWIFYFMTQLSGANTRTIGQCAALIALQFLTGHPQVFWLTAVGAGAFLVTRDLQRPWRASLALAAKNCGKYGLAYGWALLMTAIVLLPFLELIRYGNRTAATMEFVSLGAMDDWRKFFGLFAEPPADYFIDPEQNLFVGLGFLVPGLLGLVQWRNREVRALAAISILATLIVIGNHTPAFQWFHYALPGFKSFRLHSRAGMLIVMALLCGAGIWLSRSERGKSEFWALLAVALALGVLVLSFYPYHISGGGVVPAAPLIIRALIALGLCLAMLIGTHAHRRWCLMILLGLAVWELGASGSFYHKVYRFENMMKFSPEFPLRDAVVDGLRNSRQSQSPPMPPRTLVPSPLMPQNDGMIYHFSSCDAYTSLFLDRVWRYVHDVRGIPRPIQQNTFFSDQVYKQGLEGYAPLAVDLGIGASTGKRLWNTNPAPRVFLVYAATNVSNADAAIERLRNGWDISQVALAETRLDLPQSSGDRPTPVRVKSFSPNEIVVELNCDRDALLVLSEAWYPGWKALDRGRTIDSIVVNGWMRAFPVSAGANELRISYRQTHLALGLAISLAAWVSLALVHFGRISLLRN